MTLTWLLIGETLGGIRVALELNVLVMNKTKLNINNKVLQINGSGLFSKEEVSVSISKIQQDSGIIFNLDNEKISAVVDNVSHSNRNTVLTKGSKSICLVEHFLAACSLLGIDDIEAVTDKNELIFDDGSAIHWYKLFLDNGFVSSVNEKYDLADTIFLKSGDKEIAAIPHNGFKVSYFMDWEHPALGKLWASWQIGDDVEKLLQARSFATKEENDFFNASDRLLTLEEKNFNKKLYEPLEPVHHKILDIIGDLRLSGINPLEINMHVIGFKSGHSLNVELAKFLSLANLKQTE